MLQQVVECAIERTQGVKGKILEKALAESRMKYLSATVLHTPSQTAWFQLSRLYHLSISTLQTVADQLSSSLNPGIVSSKEIKLFVTQVTDVEIT